MSPTVSVITPLYNGEDYIRDCLLSVQRQSFCDYEHLIIDNCSIDGGPDIVREFAKVDSRIKLLHNNVSPGAGPTRNLGIDAAVGRYICFLDCDDYWHENKLEQQIFFCREKNLAFCWTQYYVIDQYGNFLRLQATSPEVRYENLLRKDEVIGCLTALYDTEQLGKCYMPIIRMRQDYALFLQLLKICENSGLQALGLAIPLATYRVHENGMTKNKIKAARYQWMVYRDLEALSFIKATISFISYLYNGIKDRRGGKGQEQKYPRYHEVS